MTAFDLVLLVLFVSALITLTSALVSALRGRRRAAGARLKFLLIAVLGYLGVVNVASLVWPHQRLAIGEDLCSDDWCIAVTRFERGASSLDVSYRIKSRAIRVRQRERFVVS